MAEVHPVLGHLLARRGARVPVQDGRKILLAHFGGLMVAARGAAALTAFEEEGLTNAFDEIYTMSSGFANTSYFLAGQMRMGAAAYYRDLSGFKLLKPWHPHRLANLDYLLSVVRSKRPLDVHQLFASPTKLYTMLTKAPELDKGLFLELHDFQPEEYFDLLRACSSLPIIAKEHVMLRGEPYRDVFYSEALKDFIQKVMASGATDLVLLYNYEWQRSFVRAAVDLDQPWICELMPTFGIGRKEWRQKLSRLDTRSWVLRRQAQQFGNEIKLALGDAGPVNLE